MQKTRGDFHDLAQSTVIWCLLITWRKLPCSRAPSMLRVGPRLFRCLYLDHYDSYMVLFRQQIMPGIRLKFQELLDVVHNLEYIQGCKLEVFALWFYVCLGWSKRLNSPSRSHVQLSFLTSNLLSTHQLFSNVRSQGLSEPAGA